MKLRCLWLVLFALLLACCLSGCRGTAPAGAATAPPEPNLEITAEPPASSPAYLECRYYEEKGFLKAVEQASPYTVTGRMLAATSPHFLPAMNFTANILSTLAQQGYSEPTIYVLAPDHSGAGRNLIVADRGWQTPFGPLALDEEATAALLNAPQLSASVDIDHMRLQSDHSAATLMPFIKYYLPEARVVTVLLSRGCSLSELSALAALINESGQDKDLFVLASVDFSHYLPIEETAARDTVTEALIKAGDIQALKALDGGNIDSPESIITLLYYAANFATAKVELYDRVIMPESTLIPHIGYSYNVYIFSEK